MAKIDSVKDVAAKTLERHSFRFKSLISVGLLIYCSRFIDFEQLQMLKIGWSWIAYAWLLILLDYVIGAMRFKALADHFIRIHLPTHIKYYFWSGFFNAVLPSSIGGDAMRMIWLKNHDADAKTAISLVFVERVLGILTLILIAGVGAIMIEMPAALQGVIEDLWLSIGAGLLVGSGLVLILRETMIVQQLFSTLSDALDEIALSRFFMIFVLSLLYQVITVTITICIAKSIGLELNLAIWLLVVPLVWLLTVIPISVGGLGVREFGFVFFLGAFGEFAEQAVVLGLLIFVVYLLAGLVGGAWYLYDDRNVP